jgi:hypothetical protein
VSLTLAVATGVGSFVAISGTANGEPSAPIRVDDAFYALPLG